MRIVTFDMLMQMIHQIRALTLSWGESDTVLYEGRSDNNMHDIDKDIHWYTAGQYLIVYIESYDSYSSYSYRLYRCSGNAVYDRRIVSDTALESDKGDSCTCLFNLEENMDQITKLYLQNADIWYADFEKTISGLISEE